MSRNINAIFIYFSFWSQHSQSDYKILLIFQKYRIGFFQRLEYYTYATVSDLLDMYLSTEHLCICGQKTSGLSMLLVGRFILVLESHSNLICGKFVNKLPAW